MDQPPSICFQLQNYLNLIRVGSVYFKNFRNSTISELSEQGGRKRSLKFPPNSYVFFQLRLPYHSLEFAVEK